MRTHKTTFLMLLCLCAALCLWSWAAAAPALTDGETIAWIGEEQHLFLLDAAGHTYHLPLAARDILSFSDTDLYCLMANRQVYAVKKDGSGSAVVGSAAQDGDLDSWLDQRAMLQNGQLVMAGASIADVAAWTTDGKHIFAVTGTGDSRRLVVHAMDGTPWPDSDTSIRLPAGEAVPEPLQMTALQHMLVITATDHSLWTLDLPSGTVYTLPAIGDQTQAAAVINGEVYRYLFTDAEGWQLEDTASATANQAAQATATPVLTSAPVITATPTPKATATPRAAATATPAATDDGLIHKGDSGSRVRKMQNRLAELGYPVGNVDGSYGDQTQLALNLFYDALGLREHSYLTEKAEKALYAATAPAYDPYMPLKKGDEGVAVLWMQQQLSKLGYDPGKFDGIYGTNTIAAVARFQAACELPLALGEVPGEYASRELLMRLFEKDPAAVVTVPPVEWVTEKEGLACYLGGKRATGWQKIDKKWYYFNKNGILQTGWISVDGSWYYSNKQGVMQTGWLKVDGHRYYLDSSGKMVTGWFEDTKAEKKAGGKGKIWYWFDENGHMATGKRTINGKVEVFGSDGVWQGTK